MMMTNDELSAAINWAREVASSSRPYGFDDARNVKELALKQLEALLLIQRQRAAVVLGAV